VGWADDEMMPTIACVEVAVASLGRSRAFYETVLPMLGIEATYADDKVVVFGGRFKVYESPEPTANAEITFTASSRDAVSQFHRAGIGAGFRDLEPPTMHPGRFTATLEDPDENFIGAVYRITGTS
jgi:catechol 2,3-dioxygenase-like lactoylglutathione lyase family enzyme